MTLENPTQAEKDKSVADLRAYVDSQPAWEASRVGNALLRDLFDRLDALLLPAPAAADEEEADRLLDLIHANCVGKSGPDCAEASRPEIMVGGK